MKLTHLGHACLLVESADVPVRFIAYDVLEAAGQDLRPLPQQQQEARNKRRVGLGFTGLGDALVMLGLAYGTPEARSEARRIAELMRDAAYAAWRADFAKGSSPLG